MTDTAKVLKRLNYARENVKLAIALIERQEAELEVYRRACSDDGIAEFISSFCELDQCDPDSKMAIITSPMQLQEALHIDFVQTVGEFVAETRQALQETDDE